MRAGPDPQLLSNRVLAGFTVWLELMVGLRQSAELSDSFLSWRIGSLEDDVLKLV